MMIWIWSVQEDISKRKGWISHFSHFCSNIGYDIPDGFKVGIKFFLEVQPKIKMFLSQPLNISESLLHFLLQINVQIFYTLAVSLLHLANSSADRV